MWKICFLNIVLTISSCRTKETTKSEKFSLHGADCQWMPNTIECKNNKLNLSGVGCNAEHDTIQQSVSNNGNAISCNVTNSREISCQKCQTYEEWSNWSDCCEESNCQLEYAGNFGRGRQLRYRNLTSECLKTFQINATCQFEKEFKLCVGSGGGRSVNGGNDVSTDPSNVGISSLMKIILFSVAGVVMIALFGFAGVRFVKTMYVEPSRVLIQTNRPSNDQSNHTNGQYSNVSFCSGREVTHVNELDHRLHPTANQQRGHRMMPPKNRLSIIQEEEDAISMRNQEFEESMEQKSSTNSPMKNGTIVEGSNALEYMDDIITQIEDDERAIRMEDPNYRCSVVREESFKLLNRLGWNTSQRRTTNNPALDNHELHSLESLDNLEASALSLASASLLKEHRHSPSATSADEASSLTGSESCYSLQDISDISCSPTKVWPRQYSSEPDLSRLKHTIPDIEEMLSDSDSDVFYNDNDPIA